MTLSQPYAQTIVQLYRQLTDLGFDESDLLRVKKAHEFAARLHSARFRASGRGFMAHLIGTASLLSQFTRDLDIILTGLLHAVYDQGDFGDGRRTMTEPKRKIVRGLVGDGIESRIAIYSEMSWAPGMAQQLLDRFDALSEAERDSVLVRLINELDDFIEQDVLYSTDYSNRIEQLVRDSAAMSELATLLGQPALAMTLRDVTIDLAQAQIPESIRSSASFCFDIVPPSYLRRPIAAFNYRRPRMLWQLGRVRRKLNSWLPTSARRS